MDGHPYDTGSTLVRTDKNRFIYESSMDPVTGLLPLSHSTLKSGEMVLVGNPFMAQLDFNAFYTDNSGLIYEEYKIAYGVNTGVDGAMNDWSTYKGVGGDYITTDPAFDPTLTDYIPPMQSFIVYSRSDGGTLTADILNHTVSAPANVLCSTDLSTDKNLLYVTGSRGSQKSHAVLVHWEGGDKNFRPEEDSRKLFDENTSAPVLVYLLSQDGIALDINTVNNLNTPVLLGFRTSKIGDITFSFQGMEDFTDRKIYLYDMQTNARIDLSTSPEYTFTKTSTDLYTSNRFYLIFEDVTAIEDDLSYNASVLISVPNAKTIRVYSTQPIHSLELLDVDGLILSEAQEVPAYSTCDYSVSGSGVYLLRVMGDNYREIRKVIIP